MRLAALLVIALATPAFADRPKPLPLPDVAAPGRSRARPVVIVGPSTPLREQPAIDDLTRTQLRRQITSTSGLDRIAAIDALTASLEELDVPDAGFEQALAEIRELYAAVLAEPLLDSYPHADELIARAAKSVVMTDDKLATRSAKHLLVRFPRSPFTYEAHLTLAGIAESRGDVGRARRHLETIIATQPGQRARFARLRLGWAYHQAKDYKRALAELMKLVAEHVDPLVVEAAADSLIAPYARAGRADVAATLFDRVDRRRAADRLRQLAGEYGALGKHAEEVIVLRAAMTRDRDAAALCLDRADLVSAMAAAKNRSDAEVAIAELAEAVPFGGTGCAAAADIAVGTVATQWHQQRGVSTAQLVRVWTRAAELATTPQRRAAAEHNRDALSAR